ncbi:MAG: DNA repair protein RecO [Sphaerimonospora mesophila]
MSQTIRTKAIVLRRTNYGEADRIVQVITPDHGRLSMMARGVRREKSRLAGGIELFAVCDLVLTRGTKSSSDLWMLTGARLGIFFDQIMAEYDRLQFGYEAIKQTAGAAETIDEPDFYALLEATFSSLNNLNINLKVTETWFYLRLAKLLGNELNTATDASGMKLVEDARYNFDQSDQVFVFNETGRYGSDVLKLLRILVANDPQIASRIQGINELIDDGLWLARSVAKI